MIWFTSDLHFNAERTINISKRPFRTLKELNKTLINNWNSVVAKDDIVYILGDFGDFFYAKFLNGKKVFIKGNYERDRYSNEYLQEYFDVVIPVKTLYLPVSYNGEQYHMKLTHEPLNLTDKEMTEDTINLFGHVHKLCMIKRYGINVGADLHYFTPIDLDTVLFYHNAALNYYDENVFS